MPQTGCGAPPRDWVARDRGWRRPSMAANYSYSAATTARVGCASQYQS